MPYNQIHRRKTKWRVFVSIIVSPFDPIDDDIRRLELGAHKANYLGEIKCNTNDWPNLREHIWRDTHVTTKQKKKTKNKSAMHKMRSRRDDKEIFRAAKGNLAARGDTSEIDELCKWRTPLRYAIGNWCENVYALDNMYDPIRGVVERAWDRKHSRDRWAQCDQ